MDLLQQVWHYTSGGFRGVARGGGYSPLPEISGSTKE